MEQTHEFRFGSTRYLVSPSHPKDKCKYRIMRISYSFGTQVRYTDDDFIYDFCDEQEAAILRKNSNYISKHIQAKHKAVALFKKQ